MRSLFYHRWNIVVVVSKGDEGNEGICQSPSLEAPGVVISILIPIPEIGKPISFNCLKGKVTLQPPLLHPMF